MVQEKTFRGMRVLKDASFSIFPNENFVDLRLYQFGYEQCRPLYSFGPFVRNHYLFHYVLSGKGSLLSTTEDGLLHRYLLEEGEGFLIAPGFVNTYSADRDAPWKYVWLEFDGLRASECLGQAGLESAHPIYRSRDGALREALRDSMLYIADHADASPVHLIGHLYLFLDLLIRSSDSRRKSREGKAKDFHIQEAVSFMERNYQRDLSMEEVADLCKLDRSYFGRLFKKTMGCPPQEFLIRLRLSRAAELLKVSDSPIGEIAARCGYPNQLHFSRAFKMRYGVSPREWRLQNRVPGQDTL